MPRLVAFPNSDVDYVFEWPSTLEVNFKSTSSQLQVNIKSTKLLLTNAAGIHKRYDLRIFSASRLHQHMPFPVSRPRSSRHHEGPLSFYLPQQRCFWRLPAQTPWHCYIGMLFTATRSHALTCHAMHLTTHPFNVIYDSSRNLSR
jgi:hypothetical protein